MKNSARHAGSLVLIPTLFFPQQCKLFSSTEVSTSPFFSKNEISLIRILNRSESYNDSCAILKKIKS